MAKCQKQNKIYELALMVKCLPLRIKASMALNIYKYTTRKGVSQTVKRVTQKGSSSGAQRNFPQDELKKPEGPTVSTHSAAGNTNTQGKLISEVPEY